MSHGYRMVARGHSNLAAGAPAPSADQAVPHVLGTAHDLSEVRGRGVHPRLLRVVRRHGEGEVLMDAPAALMVFLAISFCLIAIVINYMWGF